MPSLKCLGALVALVLASPAVAGEVCMDAETGRHAIEYQRRLMSTAPDGSPIPSMAVFSEATTAAAEIKRMNARDPRLHISGESLLVMVSKAGSIAMYVKRGDQICRVLDPDTSPALPAPVARRDSPVEG